MRALAHLLESTGWIMSESREMIVSLHLGLGDMSGIELPCHKMRLRIR
jgi:hypothetical protein